MDFSPDALAREVLDVVPMIMRTIRAEMRSRRSADLTIPQFRALMFLNRSPGASLLDLADHLGLTSPTVCRMVDGLVSAGLVARASSSTDRRKLTLRLTSQGLVILERARNGTQARLTQILSDLDLEERRTMLEGMQRLQSLFLTAQQHEG
jgi:MarR family transcriptional regulator for hemolysin